MNFNVIDSDYVYFSVFKNLETSVMTILKLEKLKIYQMLITVSSNINLKSI